MRTPAMAGADGPANLLAALTVAASDDARGRGALVVMNDEIHAARHVAKRHTSSTAAFESPDTGPIGRLVEGAPMFRYASRPRRHWRGRERSMRGCRWSWRHSVTTARCSTARHRLRRPGRRRLRRRARPESWVERLGALAARMPVVLASRIGAGPVLTHTYGAPGSETDLRQRGLVTSGNLNAYQARLLLLVLLSNGTADVRATFRSWIER